MKIFLYSLSAQRWFLSGSLTPCNSKFSYLQSREVGGGGGGRLGVEERVGGWFQLANSVP